MAAKVCPPAGIDLVHLGARVLTRKDGYWAQPEPYLWLGIPAAEHPHFHPFRYAEMTDHDRDPSGFADALNPNDVAITTDLIQVDGDGVHREDSFIYPTPLTPAPPTPTPPTPMATPLSYNQALSASSNQPVLVTSEANVAAQVGKEGERVAQRQAQGRNTVGVASSQNPIVNRTIGEQAPFMRLLGSFNAVQEFSEIHDVQAAHAQAAPRSGFQFVARSYIYGLANAASAATGGAYSVLFGPDTGAAYAGKVWVGYGFDPGP